MSLQGEVATENTIQFICKKIAEKIKEHPEATEVLKKLGMEMLETLPNVPEWANKYYKLFRE